MKSIFRVWVLLGLCTPLVISQSNYGPEHISQDVYHESQEGDHHPNIKEHQPVNSYEYEPHVNAQPGDPSHHQNLESKHQPKAYSTQYFRQFYDGPHQQSQTPGAHIQYYGTSEHVPYSQPEDPSYHRAQEITQHQPPENYQDNAARHAEPHQGASHYLQPEPPKAQYQHPESYQVNIPRHDEPHHAAPHFHQPEPPKEDGSHYKTDEPQYTQPPAHSASLPRGIVPTDPKLPLYFTMYEKRTIQDPLNKYGKGPWRYLTYGHGISYGTKGPGKVFEKGYGYIRALGRDHCKLPEHLCPSRDEKPFEYEGRKEPYFGYRPH